MSITTALNTLETIDYHASTVFVLVRHEAESQLHLAFLQKWSYQGVKVGCSIRCGIIVGNIAIRQPCMAFNILVKKDGLP